MMKSNEEFRRTHPCRQAAHGFTVITDIFSKCKSDHILHLLVGNISMIPVSLGLKMKILILAQVSQALAWSGSESTPKFCLPTALAPPSGPQGCTVTAQAIPWGAGSSLLTYSFSWVPLLGEAEVTEGDVSDSGVLPLWCACIAPLPGNTYHLFTYSYLRNCVLNAYFPTKL